MSDSLSELQATLAAVLAELAAVKARVALIEGVVRVYREENGLRHAIVACTELQLRPSLQPDFVAAWLGTDTSGATQLALAHPQGSEIKLSADEAGGTVTMGPPPNTDSLALVAREAGPALLMRGPDGAHGISVVAALQMAEICVHEGQMPGPVSQASMSAGQFGSSVVLRGPGGDKGMDLSVLDVASTLSLHDGAGQERAMLSHHFGSHTAFSMKGLGEHDCCRILVTQEVSSSEIISPGDNETKILSAVTGEKPVVLVQKSRRPILMLGEGEQGGIICAYGPSVEHAGIATLSGGVVTGSVALATVDGTAQLTLDATDHGGRLLINNDLGFQRIAMGVYQEAAGLHLNNTGSVGVQVVATPRGGLVTVSDPEGHVMATLPERDDDDPTTGWGRLPDGF